MRIPTAPSKTARRWALVGVILFGVAADRGVGERFPFPGAQHPSGGQGAQGGQKSPPSVGRATKKVLKNGVTAIVLENHRAPVVAVRMYVKTGSIDEDKWLGAGISHLFEHTLGEGTKTRTKEAINDLVAEVGGQANAYISKDETCYHITTASRYFEKTVDILSDELKNATFPEAEVETQKGVIRNEMAMGDDDPNRVLYKLFDYTAWRVHPVRYPIIGYPEIFDRLTRQDILDYYNSRYVPDNTLVVVAGDVEAAVAFEALEKAFADWERQPIPAYTLPVEPPQLGPRRAVEEMDIQVAHVMMGFHTVPLSHPDLYPLDVLAAIIGQGESSRLNVRVQKKAQLVHSVSAWSATPGYDAGYFGIRSVLDPGKLDAAEAAILAEIETLKKELVSSAELAKVKRQTEASFIYGNESAEDQAARLGSDELLAGDIHFSDAYVARIQKVTREEVRRVAQKYFSRENYTLAIVAPRGTTADAAVKGHQVESSSIIKTALPNGMTLLLREDHTNPTVHFLVAFMGGVRYETGANNGVSNLTAALLPLGTKSMSGDAIAEMMDAIGGSVDGFSGNNSLGASATVLTQDFDHGLAALTDVLLHPTFPQEELDRLKERAVAGLKSQEDDPFSMALLGARRLLFPNHPYGLNARGSRESLAKIDRKAIVDFYNQCVKPEGATMAVFGDFDARIAQAKIEKAFRGFTGKPMEVKVSSPTALTGPVKEEKGKPKIAQTVIVLAFRGLDVKDKDRYALDVMDGALSGINLPGGRLHARLRDNQLVYVVHAYGQPGLETGAFFIYAATSPKNRDQVTQILRDEITTITSAPISEDELRRAKVMAITAHELGQESAASQAQQAAYDELYGLGYDDSRHYGDRIEAVTAADVRAVAKRILDLNRAVLYVVEPESER